MTDLTLPIQPGGLLLDVLIGLNAEQTQDLLDAGLPLIRPLKAAAFLDTGADVSAISARLAQALLLIPVLTVQTITAGGAIYTPCYRISLSILDAAGTGLVFVIPDLMVTEMPNPPQGLEVLVGMDVLLQCVLFLDGPNRRFTLSCPP
jgi:Aspartyl protease